MGSRFTEAQREEVHRAIERIEQRTAADLDLIVTRISDRYALYPLPWAVTGALIVTAAIALIRPAFPIRVAMVIELGTLIAFALVLDWLPIRLRLVPARVKQSRAHQLAHREFAAQMGAGGANRSRVLIFVSLGERYVEIVADPRTHALAPEGTWENIVGKFITAVNAGRAADGVLAAVEACGSVLAEHHPVAPQKESDSH